MNLGELKVKLAEVETFIDSPLHADYKKGVTSEIEETESNILARPPINVEETSVVLRLHGELDRLIPFLTTFETMRDSLKADIDRLVESESIVVKTTETENNE